MPITAGAHVALQQECHNNNGHGMVVTILYYSVERTFGIETHILRLEVTVGDVSAVQVTQR